MVNNRCENKAYFEITSS